MNGIERSVDSRLWHACAGGMIQMPLPNSKVAYFPQGHAEHTLTNVDFSGMPRVPAFILCRVVDVKFLADFETDEVYAKIRLSPLGSSFDGYDYDDEVTLVETHSGSESSDKPTSFAKTLTQSDANNGGGFSVPRYCAETIFPRLDYSADPPVQTVIAKDVHGEIWKFRHIYRGTPRRHLLTTGWSSFVNHKKLVAGDSIVFMRAENGDLCVGIRRAKRGGIGAPDVPSGWSSTSGNSPSSYRGVSSFLRENDNKLMRNGRNINPSGRGKVRPEAVLEATCLAANGQPFEVTYYPRASTPEFCVKVSSLSAALRIQWCAGMRFKMAFETEDSSRISWFMGTVSSVQVLDPFLWPNSPWRLLQVNWDEPDLLQNVKRVSPWLVELVSNMPLVHLSPFSPHRKKLRLPQPPDLPQDDFTLPSFSGNPHTPSSHFRSAGIQGARHARFEIPLSDLNLTHKPQLGLLPSSKDPHDDISCLLSIGTSSPNSNKNNDKVKTQPMFLLFGQPIHIEQQTSNDGISDESSQFPVGTHSSDESANGILQSHVLQKRRCEVFLGSQDMGRTLDLSVIGSYEELHRTLASWFGIERFNDLTCVVYEDSAGAVKRIGDEYFSEFVMKAKRLTILMGACGHDDARKPITGLGTAGRAIESSKQTGVRSIFA
ncbi:Aux/IAA-ARF-dimerization [Artemisia annua]|uniref:Auxin response factor n=1 Tax=Artemisia annua TaxID=35608 RepID=A0A2U1QP78_ARTAN|nr:Aux/IAA-ARF-dimerization [Artemisia annua]